jgi:DNA replicative helicase MCM subunit Mcm2 (Cdc46/Mcm family)
MEPFLTILGITTMLNSRTSVLAAANPVFGRYDDMKSPGENIDFQVSMSYQNNLQCGS